MFMVIHKIVKLRSPKPYLGSFILSSHTETCPTRREKQQKPKCPSSDPPKSSSEGSTSSCGSLVSSSDPPASSCGSTTSSGVPPKSGLKRALKSGPVRFGFLPEEWFLFFHSKTGVSGPYIFGIVLANYLFSKEIYVMEHEYYTGLSVLPMLYFASTRLGPDFAKYLDKEIDEITNALEKGRKDEMSIYEDEIKMAKDAQWRAEGQKMLMDAKKEHIAMQLEGIYRERYMEVFRTVKNRLDYQVRLQQALMRIQQKWMIEWIIQNVKKAITPEFEKQVFEKALQDISAIAGRA